MDLALKPIGLRRSHYPVGKRRSRSVSARESVVSSVSEVGFAFDDGYLMGGDSQREAFC